MKENKYETIYLLRPDLTDDGVKKTNDKITEIVTRFQGQLTSLKDLGRRPLAYRISKHTKGHYFQLNFLGTGQVIQELERHLRLSEEAIRFLTVRDETPPIHLQQDQPGQPHPEGHREGVHQEVSA